MQEERVARAGDRSEVPQLPQGELKYLHAPKATATKIAQAFEQVVKKRSTPLTRLLRSAYRVGALPRTTAGKLLLPHRARQHLWLSPASSADLAVLPCSTSGAAVKQAKREQAANEMTAA